MGVWGRGAIGRRDCLRNSFLRVRLSPSPLTYYVGVAQLADANGSRPFCCGFDSRRPYQKGSAMGKKDLREELAEKATMLRKEAARVDREAGLLEKYPDLEEISFRWNKRCLSSKGVNRHVDKVDIRHNCGCCQGSPIEVFPYKNVGDVVIYSKPARFSVGQQNAYGYGERPHEDWQEELIEAEINPIVIKIIDDWFNANPLEEFEDDCGLY